MALVDAGIPMLDYVCACSAGCIDKVPVLDLNNLEESADTPELTVAILPRTGKVNLVEVQKKQKENKVSPLIFYLVGISTSYGQTPQCYRISNRRLQAYTFCIG